MIRWVELSRSAREGSPWLEWVRRHGLDPDHVALDSIECDDDRRTVAYLHVEDFSRSVGRRWREIQLEAPALPFPDTDEFHTGTATEGRRPD